MDAARACASSRETPSAGGGSFFISEFSFIGDPRENAKHAKQTKDAKIVGVFSRLSSVSRVSRFLFIIYKPDFITVTGKSRRA
jgi:hypothetical protein